MIYLLDADLLFGLATDVSRLLPLEAIPPFLGQERVPGVIVVGIGYPGRIAEMSEKRNRDFNPPEGEAGEINPDGASNFHRFLTEQLFSLVEASYRAEPGDRTLVGTSRGGVFVLSSLLLHPGAFQRYLAISPTVEPPIYEYERASEAGSLTGRLYLATGTEGEIEAGIAAEGRPAGRRPRGAGRSRAHLDPSELRGREPRLGRTASARRGAGGSVRRVTDHGLQLPRAARGREGQGTTAFTTCAAALPRGGAIVSRTREVPA